MDFTIKERLLLLNIISPIESDITTIKIINELLSNLSFSEEEHTKYNIQVLSNGEIRFKDDKETKLVEIGQKAKEVIVNRLIHLNELKKITIEHLSLFEKFDIDV